MDEGRSRKGDPAPREVSHVGMSVVLCVVRQFEGPGAGGAVPEAMWSRETRNRRWEVSVCPCDDFVITVCGEAWKGAMVCVGETARALILRVTGCGVVVAGVHGGNQKG